MTGTLAPPFTRENAAENARKAVASREANRLARSIALREAVKRPDIEFEVHRVRQAMKSTPVTSELYGELVKRLDSLWNKAFPTQGAVKSKSTRRESARIEPEPEPSTPQENLREIKVSSENGSNSALPSEPNG